LREPRVTPDGHRVFGVADQCESMFTWTDLGVERSRMTYRAESCIQSDSFEHDEFMRFKMSKVWAHLKG